jgi:ABC-type phosphate transport system substrate-binding protein
MKNSLLIATLFVASAGAVGAAVGAYPLTTIAGSDTLFDVTKDLIGDPAALHPADVAKTPNNFSVGTPSGYNGALTYIGGGSGNGETAMEHGTQLIAPMSKMMDNGICAAPASAPPTAASLVVGLDGVAVLVGSVNGGTLTCNGSAASDTAACSTVTDQTVGVVNVTNTRSVCGITLGSSAGWRDILKYLYFGKNQTGAVNCDDPVRICLANNYGSLFQNAGCTGVAGDSIAAPCQAIRHLFRRDDASGTTDVFGSLLGFGGPAATKNGLSTAVQVPAGMATANSSGTYFMGTDSFCNNSQNLAAPFKATPPGQMPGGENTNANITNYAANDMQDRDPIRRECFKGAGKSEQVCGALTYDPTETKVCAVDADCNTNSVNGVCSQTQDCGCFNGQCWNKKGSLGLVLVVPTTNTLGSDQFHVNSCDTFTSVPAPQTAKPSNGKLVPGLCPNGDVPSNGSCYVPADDTSGTAIPNCLATSSTNGGPANAQGQGIFSAAGAATDSAAGPTATTADPRIYNGYIYHQNSTGAWEYAQDDNGRPLAGNAFFRIHTTQTMAPAAQGATVCTFNDATDQIGCLVQASPCSIGYAGRGAVNTSLTTSIRVNGVPSTTECIQEFLYPYARKLYLASEYGFNVNALCPGAAFCSPAWVPGSPDPQVALAQDESLASTTAAALTDEGFVVLPSFQNNGQPFCEDYNENMLCGSAAFATNTNACPAVQALGIGNNGVAGFQTTCGNGIKEAFEDCDNGAANGALPATCSTTCRSNQ